MGTRLSLALHLDSNIPRIIALHTGERLFVTTCGRANNLEHIEADSLANRSALSSENLIARFDTEGRRDVHGGVFVSLLESIVFLDVVQVVLSNDDGILHLRCLNNSGDELSSDVDRSGPRAFFVDVGPIDGGSWCFDSESDRLVVPGIPERLLFSQYAFLSDEDAVLFLEASLVLLDLSCDGGPRHGGVAAWTFCNLRRIGVTDFELSLENHTSHVTGKLFALRLESRDTQLAILSKTSKLKLVSR